MVDFNSKETVGTPAIDIVRVLWLQARDNLLQSWQYYQEQRLIGSEPNINTVHARLITLFNEMEAYLRRTMPAKIKRNEPYSFEELQELVYTTNITDKQMKEAISFLNIRLDKINLIKIDTKQKYDRFDLEAENKVFGLD